MNNISQITQPRQQKPGEMINILGYGGSSDRNLLQWFNIDQSKLDENGKQKNVDRWETQPGHLEFKLKGVSEGNGVTKNITQTPRASQVPNGSHYSLKIGTTGLRRKSSSYGSASRTGFKSPGCATLKPQDSKSTSKLLSQEDVEEIAAEALLRRKTQQQLPKLGISGNGMGTASAPALSPSNSSRLLSPTDPNSARCASTRSPSSRRHQYQGQLQGTGGAVGVAAADGQGRHRNSLGASSPLLEMPKGNPRRRRLPTRAMLNDAQGEAFPMDNSNTSERSHQFSDSQGSEYDNDEAFTSARNTSDAMESLRLQNKPLVKYLTRRGSFNKVIQRNIEQQQKKQEAWPSGRDSSEGPPIIDPEEDARFRSQCQSSMSFSSQKKHETATSFPNQDSENNMNICTTRTDGTSKKTPPKISKMKTEVVASHRNLNFFRRDRTVSEDGPAKKQSPGICNLSVKPLRERASTDGALQANSAHTTPRCLFRPSPKNLLKHNCKKTYEISTPRNCTNPNNLLQQPKKYGQGQNGTALPALSSISTNNSPLGDISHLEQEIFFQDTPLSLSNGENKEKYRCPVVSSRKDMGRRKT